MRRSAETMERDQKAYDLFRRGLSYRQIAKEIGWKSQKSAFVAVRRAARENAVDPLEADAERQVFYDRFQDYRRTAHRVLAMRHYQLTRDGDVATGPDGNPLIDTAPWLAAVDRLMKADDIELRLKGLYPPAKARIEVIDDDVARALADQMEAEALAAFAEADRSNSLPGERPPGS